MSDSFRPHTNSAVFENPTLGEATTTPYLDQVEAQKREDFNARHEGREARTVTAPGRIPGKFIESGSVSSNVKSELSFAEGESEPSPVEEDYDFGYVGENGDDSSK